MENITTKINSFLPFGESFRGILQHPSISKTDINRLLKIKGIYVSNTDDETTFPLLLTNYISPVEFEHIKNRLKSRDDREKTITRTLDWASTSNLINAIPNDLSVQEIIKAVYPKYRVIGNPTFSMVDNNPNNISLDFICESQNYSKEWFRTDNQSKGNITLEKITTKDGLVRLQIVHTSPETTEIANKVVKKLECHFRDKGHTNPLGETKRITFGDFTNEQRVTFFLRFTRGSTNLSFTKASYVDIAPSPEETLPSNINWLELAKVKELHINGENLHEIHFIKDKTLHKYMELCEMTILYEFTLPYAEGNCKIKFGFPKFLTKRIRSIEFVVDVETINIKDEYKVSENTVRKSILKEFEDLKMTIYNEVILSTCR